MSPRESGDPILRSAGLTGFPAFAGNDSGELAGEMSVPFERNPLDGDHRDRPCNIAAVGATPRGRPGDLNSPLLADSGSVPRCNHSLCGRRVYCKHLTFISTRLYDHMRGAELPDEGLIHFGVYCVRI